MRYILVFLLLSSVTFGQCLKTDGIDEYTGKYVQLTKEKLLISKGLGFNGGITASVKSIDGSIILLLNISDTNIFTLVRDHEMIFKSKENKLNVNYPETLIANPVSVSGITMWTTVVYLPLDENQIQFFLKNEIDGIRYYTDDGYINNNIKRRRGDAILSLLECLN